MLKAFSLQAMPPKNRIEIEFAEVLISLFRKFR
jgi:hypothetical protein